MITNFFSNDFYLSPTTFAPAFPLFFFNAGGDIMRFGTSGWAIDGALANIIKTYLVRSTLKKLKCSKLCHYTRL